MLNKYLHNDIGLTYLPTWILYQFKNFYNNLSKQKKLSIYKLTSIVHLCKYAQCCNILKTLSISTQLIKYEIKNKNIVIYKALINCPTIILQISLNNRWDIYAILNMHLIIEYK